MVYLFAVRLTNCRTVSVGNYPDLQSCSGVDQDLDCLPIPSHLHHAESGQTLQHNDRSSDLLRLLGSPR